MLYKYLWPGGKKSCEFSKNNGYQSYHMVVKGDLHRTSKKYNFLTKSFEIVGNTRHKTEKAFAEDIGVEAIPKPACLLLANHYPEGI